MCEALDEVGLPYTVPDGAYFILVNNEAIELPDDFQMLDIVSFDFSSFPRRRFISRLI